MNRSDHALIRSMRKKRMAVSFSGGRTSAFMLKWLWDNKRDEFEILPIFANTGKERNETLDFVHRCSIEWQIPVVWVQAVIDPNVKGNPGFELTDYHRADRSGKTFEQGIIKYGLPNQATPWCTEKLKVAPMVAFLRYINWHHRVTAIGIRADEIDRINPRRKKFNLVYPLISMLPTTKADVFSFWQKQHFDLQLKSYQGNCDCCYKKSLRSLYTIASETPELFKWWQAIETTYGITHLPASAMQNLTVRPKYLYRGHRSVEQILLESSWPFKQKICDFVAWQSKVKSSDPDELDLFGSCADTCEIF